MPTPGEENPVTTQPAPKPRGFNVHLVLILAIFVATAGIFAFYALYKNSNQKSNNTSDASPFTTLINKDIKQASDSIIKPGETRLEGVKVYEALGNGTEFLAYYNGTVSKIVGRTLTLLNKKTKATADITIPEEVKMYKSDVSKPIPEIVEFSDFIQIKVGDYISYSVGDNDQHATALTIYVGVQND